MTNNYEHITAALHHETEDPLSRHLLLVIASLETVHGECLVSYVELARMTGIHRVTVIRKLAEMEQQSLLIKNCGGGAKRKNRYRTNLPEMTKKPLHSAVARNYRFMSFGSITLPFYSNNSSEVQPFSVGISSTALPPHARISNIYKYKYINKNNNKNIKPFSQTTREKGECEGKTNTSTSDPHARSARKQANSSRRQTRKHPLPDDFSLTETMRDWYAQQPDFMLTVDDATGQWSDAMLAKGFQYVDWQAAWRNGMKNQNRWEQERQQRQGGSHGRQRPLTSSEIFANLTAEALGKPKPFGSDT